MMAGALPEHSVRRMLEEALVILREGGIEDARQEARFLLSEALGLPRAAIISHPELTMSPVERSRYRSMVQRRAAREPFAYIVGHREFYGLDLEVGPDVLIPRPETEILVEEALRGVEWLRSAGRTSLVAADIGTGSGAIAVSLAVHTSDVRIVAVDASFPALSVAFRNAAKHGVSDRIEFLQGDLLSPVDDCLNLLLANLPYIPSADVPELMPEVSGYEPVSALDGGTDGTVLIKKALEQAACWETVPDVMLFEIGDGQGRDLVQFSRNLFPKADVRIERDLAGLERLLSIRQSIGRSDG